MLEFIVLGRIPGTTLQITIAWFVFIVLVSLLWLDMKFHTMQTTNAKTKRKKPTARA